MEIESVVLNFSDGFSVELDKSAIDDLNLTVTPFKDMELYTEAGLNTSQSIDIVYPIKSHNARFEVLRLMYELNKNNLSDG